MSLSEFVNVVSGIPDFLEKCFFFFFFYGVENEDLSNLFLRVSTENKKRES